MWAEIGIISVSEHPERSNQDLSSEAKAGDNVTVAERLWLFSGGNGVWPAAAAREVAGRCPLGDADILYPRLVSFLFLFLI